MYSTQKTPRPAPGAFPLVGHALQIARDPLGFVESLRRYGDVVAFRMGTRVSFMVNTPEILKELLITQNSSFAKGGPLFEQATKLIGNGLVAANGEYHRRLRHMSQPAFHHSRMAAYADGMLDVVTGVADSWRNGQVVDLARDMYMMTMDILTKTLFSALAGSAVTAEVQRSLPVLVAGVGRRAFIPIPLLHRLPLPVNRREQEALQRLYDLVDGIIADYRATDVDRGDLLSTLMLARDEQTGEGMTNEQLHDQIRSMMVAGTETSATILAWVFHILDTRPEIESRVHAEVDGVLRGKAATYDDLPRLEYLGRVVQETLRRYPTGWLLSRVALTDVTLGGYHVPAGADVYYTPYGLHHDPRVFPDPKHFDPDRWLPDRARSIPRNGYLPFGTGVRKCIGDNFAYVEIVLCLATLVRRWKLRSVSEHPGRSMATTTYRLKDARMIVQAREPSRVFA